MAPKVVVLDYNAIGQVRTIDRYSDLGGTQLVASSLYDYDSLGRLGSLVHSRPSALNSQPSTLNYSFTYDSLNRIESFTSPDGSTTYGYDPTHQLTSATLTAESYGYL